MLPAQGDARYVAFQMAWIAVSWLISRRTPMPICRLRTPIA
jgi:hypothetical protein